MNNALEPDELSRLSEVRDKRAKRAGRRKKLARDLDLSTIGMVFPIALLLGYFGGGLVGGWLGAEQLGSWIGLLLGLLSGFYNLFKVALLLQRREQAAMTDLATSAGDEDDSPSTR